MDVCYATDVRRESRDVFGGQRRVRMYLGAKRVQLYGGYSASGLWEASLFPAGCLAHMRLWVQNLATHTPSRVGMDDPRSRAYACSRVLSVEEALCWDSGLLTHL